MDPPGKRESYSPPPYAPEQVDENLYPVNPLVNQGAPVYVQSQGYPPLNILQQAQQNQQAIHVANQQQRTERIKFSDAESRALMGLRGVVAVHIMVFHALLYSPLELNLLGSPPMTLFILLSGFWLAVQYGQKRYVHTPCCTELNHVDEDAIPAKFPGPRFFQNRFARTIPLHWLTTLLCIPVIYAGQGSSSVPGLTLSLPLAFLCTSTWLAIPFLVNGPSWFVSTIWFFYWLFPRLLPEMQELNDERKLGKIQTCYWVQLIGGFLLVLIPWGLGFYVSTFWPVSRLPVFLMGCYAGLVRISHEQQPPSFLTCCSNKTSENSPETWAGRVDFYTGLIVIFNLFYIIMERAVLDLGGGFWLQVAIFPMPYLILIFGLSSDGGKSRTSQFFGWSCNVYLGKISYALYLIHFPVYQYICWMTNGSKNPDKQCFELEEEAQEECLAMERQPVWAIPIHIIISLILAVLLHHSFEEPCRKKLARARPQRKA